MKILLIEDNPGDLRLIQIMLDEVGSRNITSANRLAEGIGYLADEDFDVILLDLSLPDSQGLETLEQMHNAAPRIPIVVLTGLDNDEVGLQMVSHGAQDYLVKGQIDSSLLVRSLRYSIERKQAEIKLEREKEKAQKYLDIAGVMLIALDRDGNVMLINRKGCQIMGYQADELLGENWFNHCLPPDLGASVQDELARLMTTGNGSIHYHENPVLTKQGERRLIAWHNTTLTNENGQVVGTLSSGEDITEREKAQRALLESGQRYQALFEGSNDGVFILDLDGVHLAANQWASVMLGYSLDELIGLSFRDIIVPEEHEQADALMEALLAGQSLPIYEQTFLKKDGTRFPVEINVALVYDHSGDPLHIQSVVRDITQRKQMEATQHEQRILAEALVDTAAALNSTLDLSEVLDRILTNVGQVVAHDGANIMFIKEGLAGVVCCHGYYREHNLTQEMLDLNIPVDEVEVLQQITEFKKPVIIPDTRGHDFWAKTPTMAWVKSYVGVPICADGNVIGMLSLDSAKPNYFNQSHADQLLAFINQAAIAIQNARLYQELESHSAFLKQAVEERTTELRQTKERAEAILNNSPDAILMLGPEGRIQTGNFTLQQMFGFSVDEIYDKHPEVLIDTAHTGAVRTALQRVMESSEPSRLEVVALRRDGSGFDADIALAPVRDEHGLLGFVCSLRDITALKEVERMKDEFVSNVSHELRTPITGLKLNHRLISIEPARVDVYLDRLGREINRLDRLIEDLLRLSRLDQKRAELKIAPVDLNEVVAQYVSDRVPLAESRELKLSFQGKPGLPLVQADAGLLGQALSVLLTNALTYTPAGGKVVVSMHSRQIGAEQQVGFSVSDTGPGVTPDEMPRLFERFFRGQAGRISGAPGTGLGLAIAREIIEQHKGSIDVSGGGTPNKGATFTVWLPLEAEQLTVGS
ncbi:MAG: PAS domain S-box protein [Anaerolineae bacterium]|nr:PAS domain S-box protein [Anaerolineae bacterium]